MIIRTLPLRHGRMALARTPVPLRAWRRALTTETTTTTETNTEPVIEAATQPATESAPVQNPFERVHISEARVQSPPINKSGERFDIRDPDHPVAKELQYKHHLKTITQHVGSKVDHDHYRPHTLLTNPPWPKDITLELLMASQAHIGHATSLWHPGNASYIFGVRGTQDPIHVISLDVTATHLRRACKIVQGVAERGGVILFVGTRVGQARTVVRAAGLAKGCHLFTKWLPGTITNGQQILGKCQKKVVDEFDNEVRGYEDQLHEQAAVKPDLVVCLNPLENYILLHECGLNNIPTIGVVDTNCNPTWVTYPIPANDDSLRCIQVIAGVLGRAGQIGQMNRQESTKAGGLPPYIAPHSLVSPSRTRRDSDENSLGDPSLEELVLHEPSPEQPTQAMQPESRSDADAESEFATLDGTEDATLQESTVWSDEAMAELMAAAKEEGDLVKKEEEEAARRAMLGRAQASFLYKRFRPSDQAVEGGETVERGEAQQQQQQQAQLSPGSVGGFEDLPETADEASLRQRLEETARQQSEEEKKP